MLPWTVALAAACTQNPTIEWREDVADAVREANPAAPALVVLAVEPQGVTEKGRVPLSLPEDERELNPQRARAWLLEAWGAWESLER